MRKLIIFASAAIAAAAVSCSGGSDVVGIHINGVVWAPANVGAPGKFVKNPEDPGLYYQWNSRIGWSTTDPAVSTPAKADWLTNPDVMGSVWLEESDPCPEGWRVPSITDFLSLRDREKVDSHWTTVNGMEGMFFAETGSTTGMFMPACGGRIQPRYQDASVVGGIFVGGPSDPDNITGTYWSANVSSSMDSSSFTIDNNVGGRAFYNLDFHSYRSALSIRCVKDVKE